MKFYIFDENRTHLAPSVRRLIVRDVALGADTMIVPVAWARYELQVAGKNEGEKRERRVGE